MEERRVHTWWVIRERYRRAAWLAAFVGTGLALIPVILTFRDDGMQALTSAHVVASSAAMLAIGFFLPRWLVQAEGRWQRSRYAE
jgi:hypothetical protein